MSRTLIIRVEGRGVPALAQRCRAGPAAENPAGSIEDLSDAELGNVFGGTFPHELSDVVCADWLERAASR